MKASVILAIESAVLGLVLTFSKRHQRLSALHGFSRTSYLLGIALLLAAICCAVMVVMPQLKRWQSRRNWRSGMIYFGHLRHWDPGDLAIQLRSKQIYEEQLAAQLVAMSKIAWRKHARLQWSVLLLLAASAALLLAVLAS